MGLLDALSTAVSGMEAQSTALQNISGNIVNAQTTAFKSTATRFDDVMTGQADSVAAVSVASNNIQGSIQTSPVGTFMAITGDGYFTVQKPSGFSNGQPVFDGTSLYTRRGDFQRDGNGFLVNGSGYYLTGAPIDPASFDPAAVPLVSFAGENFLQAVDGQAFAVTPRSGKARSAASGRVVGNALEASNTDVTAEITTLLATQQAYVMDTKVVTVANEMLLTLTNITV